MSVARIGDNLSYDFLQTDFSLTTLRSEVKPVSIHLAMAQQTTSDTLYHIMISTDIYRIMFLSVLLGYIL